LQRSSAAGKAAAQPNKKLPQASVHSDPNLIDSATETKNSNFLVFQQTAKAGCAMKTTLWIVSYCENNSDKRAPHKNWELYVAKSARKKIVRREYTNADVRELRAHSKARTPVVKIAKMTKRTVGSLRQKALKLGLRLGHHR
jgi:hypothetical protein